MTDRIPSWRTPDGELGAEGWIQLGNDPPKLYWMHGPSYRCVSVEHRAGGQHYDGPRAGWYAICSVHDDNGNPTGEYTQLGPFALFTEGMTEGRRIRRHILAERKDVSIADQGELFP